MGSVQDMYAANLPHRHGYPLHSPGLRDEFEEPYRAEGFQIGDVCYIDDEGEFRPLFNICSPIPDELRKRGFPEHKPIVFDGLHRKTHSLSPGHIFMNGVRRVEITKQGETLSSGVYEFIADSNAGAVLILPSGATLLGLPENESHLEAFRAAASKYARPWCKYSGHDTLFLITSMHKTRHFALASFSTGHRSGRMVLRSKAETYEWACEFEAHWRTSPANNNDENQTIFIKGFRMTLKWGWLPVVERVTKSQPHHLAASISVTFIAFTQFLSCGLVAFTAATLIAFTRILFIMPLHEENAASSTKPTDPTTPNTSSVLNTQVESPKISGQDIQRRFPRTDCTTEET